MKDAGAAALKASVAELDQLDPRAAGKAGIQAALDKVSTNRLDDAATSDRPGLRLARGITVSA